MSGGWVGLSRERTGISGLMQYPSPLDLGYPPPVLTPSGGHQNTYSWQAGCMQPTGMLNVNSILLTIFFLPTMIHQTLYSSFYDTYT